LGAPQTTRQSRTLSVVGAVSAVGLLRLIGFGSTVFGATVPWVLSLQYIAMACTVAGSLWVVHRGLILKPPAFITDYVTALTERLAQRFAT